MTEVLLQHQNGNQLFPFLVTELFYKRMSIADDGFCFFNMCTVVLNLVFQILKAEKYTLTHFPAFKG